jgi:hypothetical protein
VRRGPRRPRGAAAAGRCANDDGRRAGVLAKLKWLNLCHTQITDAGCAALAAALESGALPAILDLYLSGILASDAAQAAVRAALATSKAARVPS